MYCICRYCIVGVFIPLIPVLLAVIFDNTDVRPELKPVYGLPQCLVNSKYGLFIYLVVPKAVIFVANLLAYIAVVIKFSILAYQTRKAKVNHREKLVLSIKLFFAFGLFWLFGILSAVHKGSYGLSCTFQFLNSLNGVLLMLVFLCNGAVLQAVKKYIQRLRSDENSTSTSTRLSGEDSSKLRTTHRFTNISSTASSSPNIHHTSV